MNICSVHTYTHICTKAITPRARPSEVFCWIKILFSESKTAQDRSVSLAVLNHVMNTGHRGGLSCIS